MITNRCSRCKILSELSVCPVCGGRTEMESSLYWCDQCAIPLYDETCSICGQHGRGIGTDVRPVFPEERLLIEVILGTPLKYLKSSCWFASGNRYIIDGKTIRIPMNRLPDLDADSIRKIMADNADANEDNAFEIYAERFILANRARCDCITAEAVGALSEKAASFESSEMFVSFSGGKDSTVTSHLTMRALGNPSIIHLYGDTTLEFPETENYVKRFRAENRKTPFLIARNTEKDFFEMCDIVGPPSRVKRWCCIIFKTGAITQKINRTFGNKKRLLTFYGIRRNESASRSKYERDTQSPKISKQIVFSPIIDWMDFDVWLYLLSNRIDFNHAYRRGYTRVGCWCCPNNSRWSEFLSRIYMPDEYSSFHNRLVAFAKKVGKPDPEEYVASGGWKARQGGNGLEVSKNFHLSFKPCATEENAFNYQLTRPIDQSLYELFKPFGTIRFDMGNLRLGEVYVVDHENQPILKLQGRMGSTRLKISILKLPFAGSPRIHEAELKLKCQLAKFQICLGCMACVSVCKHNAISIIKTESSYQYRIDDTKCKRCRECVNHFDGGCYMRDVIRSKASGEQNG